MRKWGLSQTGGPRAAEILAFSWLVLGAGVALFQGWHAGADVFWRCRHALVGAGTHLLANTVLSAGLIVLGILIAISAVAMGLVLAAWGGFGGPVVPASEVTASHDGSFLSERRVEKMALWGLYGFALIGTAYLAIGLVGLFYPSLLIAILVAGMLMASASAWPGRRMIFPEAPPWWMASVIAPAACFGILSLNPLSDVDAYLYHMAAPEKFLERHAVLTNPALFVNFHGPLLGELMFSLAVVARHDALARVIQLIPFLAFLVLAAAQVARWEGSRRAGALSVLGLFSMGPLVQQFFTGKNDLIAAAYCMSSLLFVSKGLARRSSLSLSHAIVLGGVASAVKWTGMVTFCLVIVVACWRVRSPKLLVAVLLGGAVYWPWLLKSWIVTGDPVFPFLSALLRAPMWDEHLTSALRILRGEPRFGSWIGGVLPGGLEEFAAGHMYLVVLAPLFLVFVGSMHAGVSRLALYAAVNWLLLGVLLPNEPGRLRMPVLGGMAIAFGIVASRLIAGGWTPVRWLMWFVLAAGVSSASLRGLQRVEIETVVRYLVGGMSERQVLSASLSTYLKAGEVLANQAGRGSVLTIAEERTYRLPGVGYGGRMYGHSWPWHITRQSPDPERIGVRLRQMGCTHVLYNCVSAWYRQPWVAPFTWDEARLRRWRLFVERYLQMAAQPTQTDHRNGGFCIYAIRRVPLDDSPRHLSHLPGVESLYSQIAASRFPGDPAGRLDAARRLGRLLPDVDEIEDRIAIAHGEAGDWEGALLRFQSSLRHHTITDANVWNTCVALVKLGRFDEALVLMPRAAEVHPELAGIAERTTRRLLELKHQGRERPPGF